MQFQNYCLSSMEQKKILKTAKFFFSIFSFQQRGAERVKVLEINGVQCFLKPKHSSKHFILCYLVNYCFKHCMCGRCSIIAQSIVRSHWSRSIILCVVNMKYARNNWRRAEVDSTDRSQLFRLYYGCHTSRHRSDDIFQGIRLVFYLNRYRE